MRIRLTMGREQVDMDSTDQCYFFYVSPSGAEMNLDKCRHLRQAFTRPIKGDKRLNERTWLVTNEYEVEHPITLKMVSTHKGGSGSKKKTAHIYIDIDQNDQKIKVNGMNDFGGMECRGRIDWDETWGVTEDELKELFGYEVTAPPKGDDKKGADRSLIL